MTSHLLDLARRVEGLTGPDREVDAEIAEHVYGWRPYRVGPDYYGENDCEVLTPGGNPIAGFSYPTKGALPRWYHVDQYTRDTADPAVSRDYVRQQVAASLRAIAGEGA